jgi:predicted nucleic acid-binding Zn ribbon protein
MEHSMEKYCKICGTALPDDFPTDICLDCQSIMSQEGFFKQ